MRVIYINILAFTALAWALGAMLVLTLSGKRSSAHDVAGPAWAPRDFGFADRLRERSQMVPAVVLPLMGTAFVVMAFVHGELDSMVEARWFYAVTERPLGAVFGLIYLGLAALVLAGLGFLLWPGPEGPQDVLLRMNRGCGHLALHPRRSIGRVRRWMARSCAVGAWVAVVFVIVLAPALLQLLIEVLGIEDQVAAALEEQQQDG